MLHTRFNRPTVAAVLLVAFFFVFYAFRSFKTDQKLASGIHALTTQFYHEHRHWKESGDNCSGRFAVRFVDGPFRAVVIDARGGLLERVCLLNAALVQLREGDWVPPGGSTEATKATEKTQATLATSWIERIGRENYSTSEDKRVMVKGSDVDFLWRLSSLPGVTTILLPWLGGRGQDDVTGTSSNLADPNGDVADPNDPSDDVTDPNLLVSQYYAWTGTAPLCDVIERPPSDTTYKSDVVYRSPACDRNANASDVSHANLSPVFLNAVWQNRATHFWTKDVGTGTTPSSGGQERGLRGGWRETTDEEFYTRPPPFVTYMHVVKDAVVSNLGHVFTRHMKLAPFDCKFVDDPALPSDGAWRKAPLHNEVFNFAQLYGQNVYHRMIEVLPRLVFYLNFLKHHQDIRILATEDPKGRLGELLRVLGIDPGRVVTGWVRARVVYVPRQALCVVPTVQEVQVLGGLYRAYIEQELLSGRFAKKSRSSKTEIGTETREIGTGTRGETITRPQLNKISGREKLQESPLFHVNASSENNNAKRASAIASKKKETLRLDGKSPFTNIETSVAPQNRLVLIRRSGTRSFKENARIEILLKRTAAEFDLEFVIFADNPLPSLNDTMMIFHAALIVVAPHGAGLSNLVFSRAGTFVVEGVCRGSDMNLCFLRLAVVLGLRWHGVPTSGTCAGKVDVAAGTVDGVVRDYLVRMAGRA